MPAPFRTTRRVEFADTDMAGIMHFANFFRFMESAEGEFLRCRGLAVAMRFEDQEIGLPRVAASCDYLSPARFDDVLDIEVALVSIGRKSMTYDFAFFKGEEAIARGRIVCVCCRIIGPHQFESIRIPDGLRKKLEEFI